jgi:hypothetical protein
MRALVLGLTASTCLMTAEEVAVSGNSMEKETSSFPLGGDISLALDSFRSLPDGSWGGNMGALIALNLAWAIPKTDQGFGAQLGGSYGLYDWDGRGFTDSKALQQETFISVGLFRKVPYTSGFNAGLVYDWSINAESGVFGLSPTLTQLRGQIGYLIKGGNEFGFWGTYGDKICHRTFMSYDVKFKAISQVNAFWRHSFKNQGEMMLWAGTPYQKGLMFESGRVGDYIVGAAFKAPLTRSLSVEGHGVYMGARSGTADEESKNYAANVCLGLTYSFGGQKAGARPYLPVANNSNLIVDTNLSY